MAQKKARQAPGQSRARNQKSRTGAAYKKRSTRSKVLAVPQSGIYTSTMVAEFCELSRRQVNYLAQKYHLGQYVGRERFYTEVDIMMILQRRGPGRPPKVTPEMPSGIPRRG